MLHVNVTRAPPPRALCWDLEVRPLAFWYDGEVTRQITAFGWKWADDRQVRTMLLHSDGVYRDDSGNRFDAAAAHLHFVEWLSEAGLVYGHNIRRFDLPILNGWLLRLKLAMLPPLLTTDTCKDLPKRGSVSVSLENMAAMYQLPGKKFAMPQPAWEAANALTADGVALARKRVVSDVLLQERLRAKLLELGLLKPPRVWRP